MLLRNYDNIVTAWKRLTLGTELSTDTTTFGEGHINIKDTSGVIRAIHKRPGSYTCYLPLSKFVEFAINSYGEYTGESNLICGGGDTPVSYDDYKLDVPFSTSQVVFPSGTQQLSEPLYNNTDNSWTFTYSRVFTALEGITIKEIGVGAGVFYSGKSTDHCRALVYRKVLDTPIEVPANANFILTLTIKVYANPNKPADYDATASVE